jgi:diaminohydroxyphosphoribosylaminopyrimidine deaminase / 5-amino-6-(5-phosphoribosylamino)uracil reductase
MQRCLQLAALGAGKVSPNPLVGAVLVHNDTIIGEGWHQEYGGPHAEVHCLASVRHENRHWIPAATLYVSLEPCAHHGKTPPCADLIVREGIKKVVIGCRDPFPLVNGKGIEILQAAGVEVITGIGEAACRELNKRFFTFHTLHRPYIILKWAQSKNGMMAAGDSSRVLISNEASNRLVHKWRSEEAAIMVGTNTALLDNPALTTRLWPGRHPIRIVLDAGLCLPTHLQLFDRQSPLIIFNTIKEEKDGEIYYCRLQAATDILPQIMEKLYELGVQSVLAEGGAGLLSSFVQNGLWDEARIITGDIVIDGGIPAPVLLHAAIMATQQLLQDRIDYYQRK